MTQDFQTEILVKVLQVDVSNMSAKLLIHGLEQEFTVTLPGDESARDLGNHLDHDAVFSGSATYVVDPDRFLRPVRLLAFKIATYRILKCVATEEMFDKLSEASGGVWDHVDPSRPLNQ